MTELTYIQVGDYLLPNLQVETAAEGKTLTKYGRMRRQYLQENNPLLYSQLIITGQLFPHLREIQETAQNRMEQMMSEMAEKAGATEELKASSPLKWVGLMNTLKAQAEEIVLNELIYC